MPTTHANGKGQERQGATNASRGGTSASSSTSQPSYTKPEAFKGISSTGATKDRSPFYESPERLKERVANMQGQPTEVRPGDAGRTYSHLVVRVKAEPAGVVSGKRASTQADGSKLVEGVCLSSSTAKKRGYARKISADKLAQATLGPNDIVICSDVVSSDNPALNKCQGIVTEGMPVEDAAREAYKKHNKLVYIAGAKAVNLRIHEDDYIELDPRNGTVHILGEWAEPPIPEFKLEWLKAEDIRTLLPVVGESSRGKWLREYGEKIDSRNNVSTARLFDHICSNKRCRDIVPDFWNTLVKSSAEDGYKAYLRSSAKELAEISGLPRVTVDELATNSKSLSKDKVIEIASDAKLIPKTADTTKHPISLMEFLFHLHKAGHTDAARDIALNRNVNVPITPPSLDQVTATRIAEDAGIMRDGDQMDDKAINVREFLYHLVIRGRLEVAQTIARYFGISLPRGDCWASTISGARFKALSEALKTIRLDRLKDNREIDAFKTGAGADSLFRLRDTIGCMLIDQDYRYLAAFARAYNLSVFELVGHIYESQTVVSTEEAADICGTTVAELKEWIEKSPKVDAGNGDLHLRHLLPMLQEKGKTKLVELFCERFHLQRGSSSDNPFVNVSPYELSLRPEIVCTAAGDKTQAMLWADRWPDICDPDGKWRIGDLLSRLSDAGEGETVQTLCAALHIRKVSPYVFDFAELKELRAGAEEIARNCEKSVKEVEAWAKENPDCYKDGKFVVEVLLKYLNAQGRITELRALCEYFDIQCVEDNSFDEVWLRKSQVAKALGLDPSAITMWLRKRSVSTRPKNEGLVEEVEIGSIIRNIISRQTVTDVDDGRAPRSPCSVSQLRRVSNHRNRRLYLTKEADAVAIMDDYPKPNPVKKDTFEVEVAEKKTVLPAESVTFGDVSKQRVSVICKRDSIRKRDLGEESLNWVGTKFIGKHVVKLTMGTTISGGLSCLEINIVAKDSGKEIAACVFQIKNGGVEILAYKSPHSEEGGDYLGRLLSILANIVNKLKINQITLTLPSDDHQIPVTAEFVEHLEPLGFSTHESKAASSSGSETITLTFKRKAQAFRHTAHSSHSNQSSISTVSGLTHHSASIEEVAKVLGGYPAERLIQLAQKIGALNSQGDLTLEVLLLNFIKSGNLRQANAICDYFGIGYYRQGESPEIRCSLDELRNLLDLDAADFAKQISNREDIWTDGKKGQEIDIRKLLVSFSNTPPEDRTLPAYVCEKLGFRQLLFEIPRESPAVIGQRYPGANADIFHHVSRHRIDADYQAISPDNFFNSQSVRKSLPHELSDNYTVSASGGILDDRQRLEIVISTIATNSSSPKHVAVLIVEAQPPGASLTKSTDFKLVAAEVLPSQPKWKLLGGLLKAFNSLTGAKVKRVELNLVGDEYRFGEKAAKKKGLQLSRNPQELFQEVAVRSLTAKELMKLGFTLLKDSVKGDANAKEIQAIFTRGEKKRVQKSKPDLSFFKESSLLKLVIDKKDVAERSALEFRENEEHLVLPPVPQVKRNNTEFC